MVRLPKNSDPHKQFSVLTQAVGGSISLC